MIYNWIDNLSARKKADKTYKIEKEVADTLERQGFKIPAESYQEGNLIIAPQTMAIYTILGFNPKTDSIIAGMQEKEIKDYDPKEKPIYELTMLDLLRGIKQLSKNNQLPPHTMIRTATPESIEKLTRKIPNKL